MNWCVRTESVSLYKMSILQPYSHLHKIMHITHLYYWLLVLCLGFLYRYVLYTVDVFQLFLALSFSYNCIYFVWALKRNSDIIDNLHVLLDVLLICYIYPYYIVPFFSFSYCILVFWILFLHILTYVTQICVCIDVFGCVHM